MQKCSSNVVECAIKNGDDSTRDAIIDELLEYGSMLNLLEDQVGVDWECDYSMRIMLFKKPLY